MENTSEAAEAANLARYEAAKAEAGENDIVCGYYVNGTPMYFVMPADSPDHEIRAEAFRRQNGRDLSTFEQKLVDVFDRHKDFDWSGIGTLGT